VLGGKPGVVLGCDQALDYRSQAHLVLLEA
jgi:hypothetical protein